MRRPTIIDQLTKRWAHRKPRQDRHETLVEWQNKELERVAIQAYLAHARACQASLNFRRKIRGEGIRIRVRHYLAENGKMKTSVIVRIRRFDQAWILVCSDRAEIIDSEPFDPWRRDPSSPAIATPGWRALPTSNADHSLKRVVFRLYRTKPPTCKFSCKSYVGALTAQLMGALY